LAAVIGDPVRHSLSPTIHNAAFWALNLDWVYVALPVAAGRGAAAVEAMTTLGIEGLSVTMPHKADVAAAVQERTPVVERLGMSNCVSVVDGVTVGDSTDGDGFVRSLTIEEGVTLQGRRVAVIGTGGAASAIIEAVGRQNPAELLVISRSPQRAEQASALAAAAKPAPVDAVADAEIIVNASPVGMAGGPQPEGVPLPIETLAANQVVVDIVYQPRQTPLLLAAAKAGARTVNGVGMLMHQAAIAFEHWTGVAAPLDVMRSAAFPPGSRPADDKGR